MKNLDYVDTMRGIAILLVILVHTAQKVTGLSNWVSYAAKYGQMGVQLFFVASAYTLCLTFTRRRGEPKPLVSFFIRRFFRIAPLYYFAIALYFAVHVLLTQLRPSSGNLTGDPYTIVTVFSNLLFIHGFVPSANNSIVPGGWSIGTEMAFYVCFPMLFAFFTRLNAIQPRLLCVVTIACLVLNVAFQSTVAFFSEQFISNNHFLYFNLVNQLPVFLLGMTAFFLQHNGSRSSISLFVPLQVAGVILCTACAMALWQLGGSFSFAFLPTISGLSFIFLLNLLRSINNRCEALCLIGKSSYSMYVFHFIFASYLVPAIIKAFNPQLLPELILFASFVLVTGLTYVVAAFTEQVIEARGIAFGKTVVARLQGKF